MAEKRNSAKDWRKAHSDANAKVTRIETQITTRLLELVVAHPEAPVETEFDGVKIKAKSLDTTFINHIDIKTRLNFIEKIEKYLADQHPHQQQELFEEKDFIEYHDDGDNYQHPKRETENEVLEIRLYCMHDDCLIYIKGEEGYNGGFRAETGQYCDLRNQGFTCKKHR